MQKYLPNSHVLSIIMDTAQICSVCDKDQLTVAVKTEVEDKWVLWISGDAVEES